MNQLLEHIVAFPNFRHVFFKGADPRKQDKFDLPYSSSMYTKAIECNIDQKVHHVYWVYTTKSALCVRHLFGLRGDAAFVSAHRSAAPPTLSQRPYSDDVEYYECKAMYGDDLMPLH